jgi:hypothetical protein
MMLCEGRPWRGNRHCASCGGKRRSNWLERVLGWSLPTRYLHLVFTLPHELIPLLLLNPAALYRLPFDAAKGALLSITSSCPATYRRLTPARCSASPWNRASRGALSDAGRGVS